MSNSIKATMSATDRGCFACFCSIKTTALFAAQVTVIDSNMP